VLVRQVLQHLSNDQILKVLPKLKQSYKWLVLTEHLPLSEKFVPNVDKPPGPDIRLSLVEGGSGVVVTSAPFDLGVLEERPLCSVESEGGRIVTVAYRLR
jgi:hypothetical protein